MHSATAGALTLLLCGAALGQTKREFEVATVKPAAPSPTGKTMIGRSGGPGTRDPGRVNYTAMRLADLLSSAYGVKTFQISGPSWLSSERYDITATIPEGTTKEQFAVMLQNLLLDRFKIKLHHETKEFPLYELSVAKNGPKLKASVADPNVNQNDPPPGALPQGKDGFPQLPPGRKGLFMMFRPDGFHLAAMVQSMSEIAQALSDQVGSVVVDKTGLTGTYEFTLDFAPDGDFFQRQGLPPPPPAGGNGPTAGPTPGPTAAGDPAEAPNIFTAVQDQLGLKLEKKKGPLDLIVIDQAEKTPAEN
ncbi:MAG TPA: TIGR03435 family protein [Bryobacteraceae bacterium]